MYTERTPLKTDRVGGLAGAPATISLSVLILTFNEERHIGRAIDHVLPFAREIFVIDSFSTDRTVEIARAKGAIVLQNKFVNYAKQYLWAIENAKTDSEWLMRLDADEIIEADLADEIQRRLPTCDPDITGINLKRKHIFMGRWLKHGGRYPLVLLRLWRNGLGQIEDRWMDEHMFVTRGRTATFQGGFADHNLNDLSFFTEKHNRYATREAIDVLMQEKNEDVNASILMTGDTAVQAKIKRFFKDRVYNNIPFELSTFAYFVYRYIFQLGFLDGRPGFIYSILQGYWYRFLVGAKLVELRRAIGDCPDRTELADRLQRLTGFDVKA